MKIGTNAEQAKLPGQKSCSYQHTIDSVEPQEVKEKNDDKIPSIFNRRAYEPSPMAHNASSGHNRKLRQCMSADILAPSSLRAAVHSGSERPVYAKLEDAGDDSSLPPPRKLDESFRTSLQSRYKLPNLRPPSSIRSIHRHKRPADLEINWDREKTAFLEKSAKTTRPRDSLVSMCTAARSSSGAAPDLNLVRRTCEQLELILTTESPAPLLELQYLLWRFQPLYDRLPKPVRVEHLQHLHELIGTSYTPVRNLWRMVDPVLKHCGVLENARVEAQNDRASGELRTLQREMREAKKDLVAPTLLAAVCTLASAEDSNEAVELEKTIEEICERARKMPMA